MTEPSFEVALDALRAETRSQGPECTIGKALRRMSPENAEKVQAALDNDDVKTSVIARALRAIGVTVAEQTLGRHRRKGCSCG